MKRLSIHSISIIGTLLKFHRSFTQLLIKRSKWFQVALVRLIRKWIIKFKWELIRMTSFVRVVRSRKLGNFKMMRQQFIRVPVSEMGNQIFLVKKRNLVFTTIIFHETHARSSKQQDRTKRTLGKTRETSYARNQQLREQLSIIKTIPLTTFHNSSIHPTKTRRLNQ